MIQLIPSFSCHMTQAEDGRGSATANLFLHPQRSQVSDESDESDMSLPFLFPASYAYYFTLMTIIITRRGCTWIIIVLFTDREVFTR